MRAELIAVGTEIITGQIVNTNAQFLSEKLAELGIDVYFHTAVGDNESRLLSVLEIASQRSQLIILCGGLGPTDDDLTKQTLAKFLKRDLVFDQIAMEKLDQFFASRPGRVRTPNNDRQAQLVEGSTPLQNPTGLAVGSLLEQDDVTYIVLPGPPSELKAMFTQSLQPLLTQNGASLYSRVLRFFGIGESQLVTVLKDLIENQTDPTIAPYAKTGEVTLRLSTKVQTEEEAMRKLDLLEERILSREDLASKMYGYGETNSLAQVVATKLVSSQKSLAIVDGFTGGVLQSQLTETNEGSFLKNGQILVNNEVSESAVRELAENIRKTETSDIGLAVLGKIRDTENQNLTKVVLLVAIARANETIVKEVELGGYNLSTLRQIACLHAFDIMLNSL